MRPEDNLSRRASILVKGRFFILWRYAVLIDQIPLRGRYQAARRVNTKRLICQGTL